MKTARQKQLALIAPSISIRTIWEHDSHEDDEIFHSGNALDGEDPSDWQAWQSEVRATAIVNGEEISGSGYLGGTWEKADATPEESNPDISGYEPQMTVEALEELMERFRPFYERHEGGNLAHQIDRAIRHCKGQP